MKKRKGAAVLFIIPFLLFFLLFWLIPFVYGIAMSVTKYSLIQGNKGFVGFANYIKILFSSSMYHKSFIQGLSNTVIFVVLTTPFLVFGSLFLALLLDRLPERLKGIFRTIYFASYSVSVTAVAADSLDGAAAICMGGADGSHGLVDDRLQYDAVCQRTQ